MRWYFPMRGRRRGAGSGTSLSESSSDEQGEKKERTDEEVAEGSSRKDVFDFSVSTARTGRGIACTCGAVAGEGVVLSWVVYEQAKEADGDTGEFSSSEIVYVNDGF